MANRQTYVVGALGVLVGMVVGASSAQNAQTVSFSGANPNTAAEGQDASHQDETFVRIRNMYEMPVKTSAPVVERKEAVRNRLVERLQSLFHSSAPRTIRGGTRMMMEIPENCEGLSGKRLVTCVVEGDHQNYFEIQYED